jgi:hypothetical protein
MQIRIKWLKVLNNPTKNRPSKFGLFEETLDLPCNLLAVNILRFSQLLSMKSWIFWKHFRETIDKWKI